MTAHLTTRRGLGAPLAALMLAGLVLGGCGSSDVERRQADCAVAQGAWQKTHDDLRAVAQDPQAMHDPAKIRTKFRDGAGDLRVAANKISDPKLKDALNQQAGQFEQATNRLDNFQTLAESMERTGDAILTECTRAPGR